MLKDTSGCLQALDDAERAEAKVLAEYGEESIEELGRPADLGEDEDDDLEYDKQAVEDSPESTGGLVGHGGALDVVAVDHDAVRRVAGLGGEGFASINKMVDALDVVHEGDDARGEHEEERDDRQRADDVQTNESI